MEPENLKSKVFFISKKNINKINISYFWLDAMDVEKHQCSIYYLVRLTFN